MHWDQIYAMKAPDAVSWDRRHLETSQKRVVGDTDISLPGTGSVRIAGFTLKWFWPTRNWTTQ